MLRKQLPPETIILNNLRIVLNNSEFQIDSLIICENRILLFEVKNFEGDFMTEDDRWYILANKNEIRNPLLQIKRNEFLVQKLINQLGSNFKIEFYLIFINDSFNLYNAPVNKTIIFPTQVNRLIKRLQNYSFKQNQIHQRLVNQLSSRHQTTSTHSRLPKFEFENLRKGIVCTVCNGFLSLFDRYNLKCLKCKGKIKTDLAILQSISEYKQLFPNQKITTNIIYQWCKIIKSKKTIRRILSRHFKQIGRKRSTYYIKSEQSPKFAYHIK